MMEDDNSCMTILLKFILFDIVLYNTNPFIYPLYKQKALTSPLIL